ncbi:MAG: hypothetical protein D6820_02550, partial [Lentisphaerae bacterium]
MKGKWGVWGLGILFVGSVIWLAGLAGWLIGGPFLIGVDPYFHVTLTGKYVAAGSWRLSEFPWAYASIWRDLWFDKEWLFHMLMVPFTGYGGEWGVRVFIFLSVCAVAGTWWFCVRSGNYSDRIGAYWFGLLPMLTYGLFWVRLGVCRPHLLSMALMLLGWAFMFRQDYRKTGAVALIYSLSYTGYWQFFFHCAFFEICGWLQRFFFAGNVSSGVKRDARPGRLTLWALGGMLAGTLLHPNFPNNLRGLYIQNVRVLLDAWKGGEDWAALRPRELEGLGVQGLLSWCLPLAISLAVVGLVMFRSWKTRRLATVADDKRQRLLFLIVSAGGYCVLAMASLRFLEYAVPVTALAAVALFSEIDCSTLFPRLRHRLIPAAG